MTLEDLRRGPATISVGMAAEILGVSRGSAYAAARRYVETRGKDGIPARRIGRRIIVPTAALLRFLAIEPDAPSERGPE